MGFNVRVGFGKNGIPAGNRGLRDPKNIKENTGIKNKFDFVFDAVIFIITVTFIFVRDLFQILNSKPKSLKGKICFVTGSGRGLGREICKALAREGAIIACADINEENNNKTLEILTELGAKAKAYKMNVANKQEVDAVATRVEADLGTVYLLVNNAGIIMPTAGLDENYVRAVFGVNTLGSIWTIGAFLPKMKEKNEGHIVNISSLAAVFAVSFLSEYSATKAAISAYAESLRLNLSLSGYDNIFVTTVHPGLINTSADYMDCITWRFKISTEEEVAACVLNSIKYNKATVATNPFMFFGAHFLKFLPRGILSRAASFVDLHGTVPTDKEYEEMGFSDVVKKSNSIGGEKIAAVTT